MKQKYMTLQSRCCLWVVSSTSWNLRWISPTLIKVFLEKISSKPAQWRLESLWVHIFQFILPAKLLASNNELLVSTSQNLKFCLWKLHNKSFTYSSWLCLWVLKWIKYWVKVSILLKAVKQNRSLFFASAFWPFTFHHSSSQRAE
jgi:hypothetical protein